MRFILTCFLLVPTFLTAGVSNTHMSLLEDAEISRGVLDSKGIQWTVKASSENPRKEKNAKLRVKAQHGSALAEILEPETSAGKKYLLTDGTMYFYRPGTQRAVTVPRRQQVAGDAAIGDIASTSFLAEYFPDNAQDDTLNGEACVRFELKNKPGTSASYAKILLWVSSNDRVFRKAEFYTRTGRHIRTAGFEHRARLSVGGKSYPLISRLEVVELLGLPQRTNLYFSDHRITSFPKSIFDRDSLATSS